MIEEHQIKSAQGFLAYVSSNYFTENRGQWVFRGHSDRTYDLTPSIGRNLDGVKDPAKHEKSVFDIFCREALMYLPQTPRNDWEWLAIAQHHGLPTRLLDWTHNVLVALYFSVNQNFDQDGEVLALNVGRKMPLRVVQGSPFVVERPYKFYPPIVAARIRAQEGLFVVCSEIAASLDEHLPKDWGLTRFKVPSRSKEEIRYQLYRMGVHGSSMFPDIDGLAARIKWQHSAYPLTFESPE